MCKNTEKKYRDVWEDHLVYLAYLPYSMTLIVLFEDFTAQLHTRLPHRTIGSKDLRFVGFFAVRLIVWYFAYEFVLHFIHVHSIFNSPVEVVHRLSNYEMSAVAYVAGQLFYNKYVVMFGMPSLFAYLDGRPHNTEGVSTLRGALIGDLCSWM
ncbi:unnamed protein product [Heligmosomoides polygyrus]|uniref:TLC domain-containing protein n=1 Tax=Heligmosomoides polygyrus TaxID=6339 RepID=A0A183GJ57_HELPZ|nr:unnamed protein product [Heligmosomoides polygyrus]